MSRIRIGTCSWRFPSWHGLVYSRPDAFDDLHEYARLYDTVEIDRWFWSLFGEESIGLPDPADVQAYRSAVGADFRFTVKAPNSVSLTHFYRQHKDEPLRPNPYFLSPWLCGQFLSLLDGLLDVLGPVMFQFEYLNRQKMPSQEAFQAGLETLVSRLPGGIPYGVEVRNPPYLNDAFFASLSRRGLIPVLLEGYWMPPIARVYEQHRARFLEHDTAILRLLGPDREGIEEQTGKQWNQIVTPHDPELREIADLIRDLVGSGVDVYVNVNNHYEGSAPLTIRRLQGLLEEGQPPAS